jgi:hypothetical protein
MSNGDIYRHEISDFADLSLLLWKAVVKHTIKIAFLPQIWWKVVGRHW